MNRHVDERPILYAPASSPPWHFVVRRVDRDKRTVTTKAVCCVEYGRLNKLGSWTIQRPVPIRLRATVSTLLTQYLLVIRGEETMPGEEVTLDGGQHRFQLNHAAPTTKCMNIVWLMCVATRSSYRESDPGAAVVGVTAGFSKRHCTAATYSSFSALSRDRLTGS